MLNALTSSDHLSALRVTTTRRVASAVSGPSPKIRVYRIRVGTAESVSGQWSRPGRATGAIARKDFPDLIVSTQLAADPELCRTLVPRIYASMAASVT